MLTQAEKDLLLSLLGSVNVSGTRQKIKTTMEMLDALERKIQAMPVEKEEKKVPDMPKGPKGKK